MKFEDFLEQEINNFKKDNLKNLKSFLDSSAGKTKIENFKKRNADLDVENIYNDALNGNQYAIAILKKDPKKQNVTEKAFFNFTDLEKLPQGYNGIRFGGSKAADFKIGEYYGT